jgi:hypothetical protein
MNRLGQDAGYIRVIKAPGRMRMARLAGGEQRFGEYFHNRAADLRLKAGEILRQKL